MRILVLEDEVLVALDLQDQLTDQGHDVVGPAATVAEAEALVETARIDYALLDVNVRGEIPSGLVRVLIEREIAFAYVSGHDLAFIRARLPAAPVFAKPLEMRALSRLLKEHQPSGA